eukprot:TRINITY_DN4375_c1_g1_i1.p1 TRINITY_DN4375_c1_g1~~TRINITY_DN4375_c1_g1_i1.p1  ORF type:complete len:181 (+),score=4.55 TRINITY_DN4375_c1_g1_i1:1470-2012(+)
MVFRKLFLDQNMIKSRYKRIGCKVNGYDGESKSELSSDLIVKKRNKTQQIFFPFECRFQTIIIKNRIVQVICQEVQVVFINLENLVSGWARWFFQRLPWNYCKKFAVFLGVVLSCLHLLSAFKSQYIRPWFFMDATNIASILGQVQVVQIILGICPKTQIERSYLNIMTDYIVWYAFQSS